MMVLSLLRLYKRSQTSLLDTGSIPVVGSSRKITLGFPIQLIAIESLLLIPPENVAH